jgi:lipoyl(octanoyl) transferase
MIWRFINTGLNTGSFNMDYDLELVRNFSGAPVLRVYQWKPYCISLGANQDYNSVNQNKAFADGFDIVKRPTGGRAILHAEELTYSVVFPLSEEKTPKQIYREINLALKNGLKIYNPVFDKIELEHTQPHFPTFYKDTKSTLCFAVSAMNELNYQGKKVVGSAQRKIGNVILQHGSILCGNFHKRIIDYLNLPDDKLEEIKNEIERTTIELEAILDIEINYQKLSDSIKEGFENHFNFKIEEEIFAETISQVN